MRISTAQVKLGVLTALMMTFISFSAFGQIIPINDDCSNALKAYVGDIDFGTTTNATADAVPFCVVGVEAPGVWYTIQGHGDTLVADLCTFGALYNARINVYSGSCGSLVCVTGDDNTCGPNNYPRATWLSQMCETYYVLVQGTNGETGDFIITFQSPTPSLIANPGPNAEICEFQTYQLPGSASGTFPPFSFSWSPATNLSDPNIANPIFTPPSIGTYTYTLTVTDDEGCTDANPVTITVHPLPVVSFTGLNPEYCLNDAPTNVVGNPPGGVFSGPVQFSAYDTILVYDTLVYGGNKALNIGSLVTTTTEPAPVNIWYRTRVLRVIYTAAELSAAGMQAGNIQSMGWDIVSSPIYSIPGYTIKFQNTGITDPGLLTTVGWTTVKNPFNYAPVSGGYEMLALDNVFNWDGTSNIAVEVCWDQIQPDYDASGTVRYGTVSNSVRSYQSDVPPGGTSCGQNPTTYLSTKFNIQFTQDWEIVIVDTLLVPLVGVQDVAVFDPGIAGPGTHWIYYTYTDPNGCTNVDSQMTIVHPLPVVSFSGLDPEYCLNSDSSILIGSPSGGTFSGPVTPFGQTLFDTTIVATCDPINDFAGYYDPANWTFENVPAGVNGSVNTAGAPASITLTGGDAGVGGSTQYRIDMPCEATVTFDWSYSTGDGPDWDPFGYVLNGIFVELTNPVGSLNQSGSASVNVAAGDVFGFSQNTADGFAGPGITTITNFVGVESGVDTIYTQFPAGDVAIFYPDQAGVGTHWVVYSFTDSNGCTNTDSQMVEVLPLPVVTSSGINPTPYCIDNQTYPLTGSPVGGVFSGPGVTDLGNGQGEWSPAAAGYVGFYDIVYTFTDSNGCTNADTQTAEIIATGNDLCEDAILVQVGQTISGTTECATMDTAPFCVVGIDAPGVWYRIFGTGGNITVDLCHIPGTTYDTRLNIYSGDCNNLVCVTGNDDGPGCGFAYPSTVTWASSPCVEYFILVQGFNGLVGDFVMSVSGNVQSLNAHAGPDRAICEDATTTLGGSPTATGGNPGYTYNWSPAADLNDPTLANPVFTPPSPGTYTFTVTVTDNTNCTAEDEVIVTVNELPSPVIVGLAPAYCVDDEMVVISGDPTGGTFTGPGLVTLPYGGTVYHSSFTAVPQAIPNNDPVGISISHTVNVPGTGLGVDINLDSVTVVINHTWVGDLYLEIENPAGTIVTLLDRPGVPASATGCSADNVNATFVLGTGNSAESACDFTFPQVAIKGNYTAHDGFDLNSLNDGTSPNGAWEVTVKDLRNPDFGSVQGITLHFSGQGTGFDPTLLAPGTYTITYTYTDGNGCTGSVDQEVTINDLPVVSFTGLDSTYCYNDPPAVLTGNPSGGVFFGAGIDNGYTSSNSYQVGFGSLSNSAFSYPAPFGNYFWGAKHQFLIRANELIASGAQEGFLNSIAFNVTNTNGAVPHEGFRVAVGATGASTLTAHATGLTDVKSPATVTPVLGWNTISFDQVFYWDGVSNLVVEVCFNNGSYVVNASTELTDVGYTATRYYIADNATVCAQNTSSISNFRPNMQFGFAAGFTGVADFTPADAGPGSHTITYVYTDSNGCSNSASQTTFVYDQIFVDAGVDATICENETIELGGAPTASGGTGNFTYSWAPAAGLDNATASNPIFTPSMSTTIEFTVTVTDSVGCMESDVVEIFVDTIPNVTLSGLDTFYCLNYGCDTLTGFPPGGTFAGPGVIVDTTSGGGGPIICNPFNLTTTLASGNGQNGAMFDLEAINDLTVTGFSGLQFSAAAGTPFPYEIYFKTGTHVGFQNNPGAWTFLGAGTAVTNAPGIVHTIPIPVNVNVGSGQRVAFYITTTNQTIAYTNGTFVGDLLSQDANMMTFQGYGNAYPFGGFFQPRNWNGVVHYEVCSGGGPGGGGGGGGSGGCNSFGLDIGNQVSVFSSTLTRGLTFQAPVDFTITSLMVPNTVTPGPQCIQVVLLSGPPSVWPNVNSPFTTLYYTNSATFGNPVAVNIPVSAGDWIGILGASNPSGTTMANSYGPNAPYATTIGGQSVDLHRFLYQGSISAGPAPSPNVTTEVGFQIGRIEMEYEICGAGGGGGGGQACVPDITGSLGQDFFVNDNFSPSPVNIWFRRSVIQMVYTAAELNAMGFSGPTEMISLGWHVYNPPLYSLPGYTVKMRNTNQANMGIAFPTTGWDQVKNPYTFTPTSPPNSIPGTVNTITFDTPFQWDGVSNVGIEVCWSQVQPGFNASGQLFVDVVGGSVPPAQNPPMRFSWTDAAGSSCGEIPASTLTYRPWITLTSQICTALEPAVLFCPDSAGPGQHWITYTYTGDNGCTNTDSVLVTVADIPTVVLPPDTIICAGDAISITAVVSGTPGPYTYEWSPSAGLDTTSGPTVIASPDTSTEYTVVVTDSIGCTNFATILVEIRELPIVDIIAIPGDSICFGDSVILVAQVFFNNVSCLDNPTATCGVSYPLGCAGFLDIVDDFYTTGGMTNITNMGSGCNGTPTTAADFTNMAVTVPVGGSFDFGVKAGPTEAQGFSIWIDFDQDGNFSAAEHMWSSPGSGLTEFNGTINIPSSVPCGTYRMRVRSAWICVPAPTQGCGATCQIYGEAEDYTMIVVDQGIGSLVWSTGDTTDTITVSPTSPTQYWVMAIDDIGCTASDTIDIFVNPEIFVDAGADVDLCQGSSVMLGGAPTASGGSGTFTYLWVPEDRLDDPTIANPTTNTILSLTYTVYVTDESGCVVSDEVRVTSRDLPLANAGNDVSICDGQSVVIGGIPAATGGTGPYTYNWMPAADLNDPTLPNPTANPTTTTIYTLIVADIYGCEDDSIMKVIVYPLPIVAINPVGPFCGNDAPVTLTAQTGGGTWSGPGIVNASTGLFDPAAAGAGTHDIVYTNASFFGCVDSDTIQITVHPIPNLAITSPTNYCLNGIPVILTANVAGGFWSGAGIINTVAGEFDPAAAGLGMHLITYTYTDVNNCVTSVSDYVTVELGPDPAINPVAPLCSSDPAITLTGVTPGGTWSGVGITNPATGAFNPGIAGVGSHTITHTVTGASGCIASANIVITVNGLVNFGLSAAGPFCEEAASVLLNATVGGGYWHGPGIVNPLTGEFRPAVAGPGTHTIIYTITSGNGCISRDSTQIIVNASPSSAITVAGPYCSNDAPVTLTAATAGGSWSGPGITNATTGEFDPNVAGPGSHTVVYSVTDLNGCSSSSTRVINVNELPVISGTAFDVTCPGDGNGKIEVRVEGGAPPYSYNWSNGATTLNIDEVVPGTYTLTVTDAQGCSDEATFTIGTQSTPIAVTANVTHALTPTYDNGEIDITVTGGTPPYSYNWSNGAVTQDISGLRPDTFRVTITDALGCSQTFTFVVNAQFQTGVDISDLSKSITLYPNPTSDVININIELGGRTMDLDMTVYDVLGRKVYERADMINNTYNHSISMATWASGQYMIRFKIGDEIVTKKFVLTK